MSPVTALVGTARDIAHLTDTEPDGSRGSMRLPTLSRSRNTLIGLLAASAFLGACSSEVTAPVAATAPTAQGTSAFQPSAATRALVGITDGTYTFTVDPTREQRLFLGSNALFIPANAVCDLATSSYGVEHWDESCTPQASTFVITAVVKNAASNRPSIEFEPALRFNPRTNVELYFYVPHGTKASTRNFIMDYCDASGVCYDESLTDASLTTYFDPRFRIVYRRIKHFSGYLVTGAMDDSALSSAAY
jgi:hypothetical protein